MLFWCRRGLLAVLFLVIGSAQADIALPAVNGQHYRPHFWDLPTQFKGRFFAPGQMLFFNSTDRRFDAQGQAVALGDTVRTTFGITALPILFKFDDDSRWAYIAGIDVLELRVNTSAGQQFSGVGNVLGDFIAWTKPDADSTAGVNVLLGTPANLQGDRLSNNRDVHVRGFYSRNLAGYNMEGTLGYQHTYDAPASAGAIRDNYHVNLRLGRDQVVTVKQPFRMTPFIGLDRMWTDGGVSQLTNASLGLHFAHAGGTSWGFSRVRSLSGRNAPFADMLQVQLWLLY